IDNMAILPIYLNDSKQASERLHAIVKEGEAISRQTPAGQAPFSKGHGKPKVMHLPEDTAFAFETEQVHFTFPGEERQTLQDITIHIPAGSKTAIVGQSGSGKSALLHLLLNMYTMDQGTICVNGQPTGHSTPESLWETCNVVLQENHFFYGT